MRAVVVVAAAALVAAGCSLGSAPAPTSSAHPARSPSARPPLALALAAGFDVSPGLSPAPPDAAVAVGPTAILTADNAEVRLQDRAGNPIANSTLRDLFGPAHLSPAELQTDPRAVYDTDSGRFLVVTTVSPAVNCVRSACPTGTLLAVSTSSAPADLSGQSWRAWLLPGWAPGAAPAGAYLDFPDFSVSRDAIVMTVNVVRMSPPPGTLPTTVRVRVIDKAAALNGTSAPGWADVDHPQDDSGTEILSLQPAVMDGVSAATPMFLAGVSPPEGGSCRVIVAALGGTLTAPALTARSVGSRLGCASPPKAGQPGGAKALDTGGYGLSSRPFFRDGRLWFARSVASGGPVAAIHWGELDVGRWPGAPALVQESLLGAPQSWAFFPALTIGAGGAVVVVFARSSSAEPPSIYFSGRLPGDPPASLRSPTLVKAGLAAQVLSGPNNRYGDFFDATVDPADQTVWALGEYTRSATTDGMWLAHIT